MDTFLNKVDKEMREDQKIPFLDITLLATSARWWRTHCNTLREWKAIKKYLRERFG